VISSMHDGDRDGGARSDPDHHGGSRPIAAVGIALGAVVALLQIEPPPAGHDQPALLGDNLEAIAREIGIAIAAVIGLFGLFLQLTISAHARAASAARAPR
jgi:hypothetical protein